MITKSIGFLAVLLLASGCDIGSGPSISEIVAQHSQAPQQAAPLDDTPAPAVEDEPSETPAPTPTDDPLVADVGESPINLRSFRYSASAGQIYWDSPSDATATTRYLVQIDGNAPQTVAERTYLAESLVAGVAHTASVSALNLQNQKSAPATIQFSGDVDVPPPNHDFELTLDRTLASLDEGNTDGATITIAIAPEGDETVNVAVQAETTSDKQGMSIELGSESLSAQNPGTSVTFKLPIGMQPIKSHQRRFKVVATSGEEVRSEQIVLDVKPTDAADVYLLIGQSNMVGSSERGAKDVSPGGPDERSNRIWQLNVSPNNSSIFTTENDFADEARTAIDPLFIEAEDPLHDPRPSVVPFKGGTSIGPGMSFAKAALADTTQKIYLVPAAWGATGFCKGVRGPLAWNAGNTGNASVGGTGLLERAFVRLRMTLSESGGVFRGILWHQGGADSNIQACADSYERNIKLMVERIRREAAHDRRGSSARGSTAAIPFIVATQSRGKDGRGDYSQWTSTKVKVDAVHRNISNVVPFADWVNNDDLVPPGYPCGSSSCVHFGALANRETGRRLYQALKRVWDRGS